MANVSGIPEALVLVQRARDILTQVTDGKIDIGITGMDLVEEYRTEGSDLFVLSTTWPSRGQWLWPSPRAGWTSPPSPTWRTSPPRCASGASPCGW